MTLTATRQAHRFLSHTDRIRELIKNQVILHTAFILDGSGSMEHLKQAVVRVVDEQVRGLANQSTSLNQETRVTFYWFDDEVFCAYYDKDVLRLPSIADFYAIDGLTALAKATLQGIRDLKQSATLYGQHDFLLFVVTDGFENASLDSEKVALKYELQNLPVGWQVAILVPDERSRQAAINLGFPVDNILIWDAKTERGLVEASTRIQTAVQDYAVARSQGIRPTSLFTIDSAKVTKAIEKKDLQRLDPNVFNIFPVKTKSRADEFSKQALGGFTNKTIYYQLTKTELVQGKKKVLLRHNATDVIFGPEGTRSVLGLPEDGTNVVITPKMNPDYTVFVQSTAPNRALLANTNVIITNTIL